MDAHGRSATILGNRRVFCADSPTLKAPAGEQRDTWTAEILTKAEPGSHLGGKRVGQKTGILGT